MSSFEIGDRVVVNKYAVGWNECSVYQRVRVGPSGERIVGTIIEKIPRYGGGYKYIINREDYGVIGGDDISWICFDDNCLSKIFDTEGLEKLI